MLHGCANSKEETLSAVYSAMLPQKRGETGLVAWQGGPLSREFTCYLGRWRGWWLNATVQANAFKGRVQLANTWTISFSFNSISPEKRGATHTWVRPLLKIIGYILATLQGHIYGFVAAMDLVEARKMTIVANRPLSSSFGKGGTTLVFLFLPPQQLRDYKNGATCSEACDCKQLWPQFAKLYKIKKRAEDGLFSILSFKLLRNVLLTCSAVHFSNRTTFPSLNKIGVTNGKECSNKAKEINSPACLDGEKQGPAFWKCVKFVISY